MSGSRVGPYEIVSALGAGGMGEVYRAHDARLGRDVAIKVLPTGISADPARRQRFEIEARAVAALNHPHICAIHDVGADGGVDYLVLELVEGETLAARLARGPLPVAEALARARDIAGGLAHAHRLGIVHRDLKPGNVMLGKSGLKILDFGLAKVLRGEGEIVEAATRAATGPLTGANVVLGTLQYMAPEQIEGRAADARTDVFAFGLVLYEILSARKAFEASSTPGLIGAILRDEAPSVAAQQPGLPVSIDRLIRTCLAKNPDERFASMHDVGIALDWVARDLESAPMIRAAAAKPLSRWWLAAAAGVLSVAAAASGYYWYGRKVEREAEPPSTYVFDVPLPEDTTYWAGFAISPDGRQLAVVTQPTRPGRQDPRLWIRDLESTDWQLVSGAGDEIPMYPIWSPDGRSLAFFVSGKLVRTALPTVAPVPICDAPDARGGAWLDDGTIVFAPTSQSGLMRVNAGGGTPEVLMNRREGEVGLKFPARAGNGRLVFWAQHSDPVRSELRLLPMANPADAVSITRSEATAVYDAGTLFYLRSGVLVGQPLDADGGRLEGAAVRVALDHGSVGHVGYLPLSAGGGHVAVASVEPAHTQLRWVGRTGKSLVELGEPSVHGSVDISPNGRRVAIARTAAGESRSGIWIVDAESGATRRAVDGHGASPVWAPDSRRLAFTALRGMGGNNNLYQIDVDRPPAVTALAEAVAAINAGGWIPDGSGLVLSHDLPLGNIPGGISIRAANGQLSPFRASSAISNVRVSPDGRRIAYQSRETGQPEVFLDSFPSPGASPVQVSRGGGRQPRWRGDGRELFFIASDRLMAAPVSASLAVSVGAASPLFTLPSDNYAAHPDGQRFLVLVPTSPQSATVRITLNVERP